MINNGPRVYICSSLSSVSLYLTSRSLSSVSLSVFRLSLPSLSLPSLSLSLSLFSVSLSLSLNVCVSLSLCSLRQRTLTQCGFEERWEYAQDSNGMCTDTHCTNSLGDLAAGRLVFELQISILCLSSLVVGLGGLYVLRDGQVDELVLGFSLHHA